MREITSDTMTFQPLCGQRTPGCRLRGERSRLSAQSCEAFMTPKRIVLKLTQFVESEDLELRKSAIRVIAELGLSSKGVMRALGRCLSTPDDGLRMTVLHALSRLGAGDACRSVVPLILAGGPLREQAMQVLESAGPFVVSELKRVYGACDFHAKRAVISTLGRIGRKESISFLLEILPDEAFELQKHITVQVAETLDRVSTDEQAGILSLLGRLMKSDSNMEKPQVLATVAMLLGHFRGDALATRARRQLRSLTEGMRANGRGSPEVWRHIMVSFDRLAQESAKLTHPEQRFVEQMLCDEDWSNVAQYALNTFKRIEIPASKRPDLVGLLDRSPHFSVHIHVFERLESSNSPEVAKAILPFLADSRFRVREAAQAALRRIPSAIESLFSLLMKTTDLEVTQRVNTILRDFPQETRKKYLATACKRLLSLYEQNDPHYKSFLEFIRGVDPGPLRTLIYQEAWAIKGKKGKDKWKKIANYLQLLWDHHLIDAEGRYLLGIASLRLNSKELAPAARRANLGLKVLRALVYDHREGLVRKLRGDKDLRAEDYYYLGFHFCEEGGEMRPFGMAMLRHVVRKFPRTRLGVAAKRKLEALAAEDKKAVEAAGGKASRASAKRAAGVRAASAATSGKAAAKARSEAVEKKPGKKTSTTRKAKKAALDATKKRAGAKSTAKKATKSTAKKPTKSTARKATKSTAKKAGKKAGKKPAARKKSGSPAKKGGATKSRKGGKAVRKKPTPSKSKSSRSRKRTSVEQRKKGKSSSKAADSRALKISKKSRDRESDSKRVGKRS